MEVSRIFSLLADIDTHKAPGYVTALNNCELIYLITMCFDLIMM